MEGWRIFDLIIVFNENVAAGAVDYVDKRPKENAYQPLTKAFFQLIFRTGRCFLAIFVLTSRRFRYKKPAAIFQTAVHMFLLLACSLTGSLVFFLGLVICNDLFSDVARHLIITFKAHFVAAASLCHLTDCDSIVEELSLRCFGENLLFP